MSFLQQPIEKKLSRLLGATVTFERLKLSPLIGRLEAEGMIVSTGDAARPLLRVRAIRASVSVARALKGEIIVKSLTIEGPDLVIVRRADGSTNLPPRPAAASNSPAPQETNPPNPQSPSALKLESATAEFSGGQIHFHDEAAGRGYHLSAEYIRGEFRHDRDARFTAHIDSLGRRDHPAALGPVEITAQFSNVADLMRLAAAPLEASISFPGGLTLGATAPSLDARMVSVELTGPIDAEKLLLMLPPGIKLPPLQFHGKVEVNVNLDASQAKGIHIHEFNCRAADVLIPKPC